MRRRIVRPNTRSYTGRHEGQSDGDRRTVRFESGLEKDFLTLVRFHPDFLDVLEQPGTFLFTDSTGKKRSYTPDFSVTFTTKTVIYEVKYREDLRKDWPRYREILRFMRARAREDGRFYRIITEALIRTPKLENLRLLAPHRKWEPDEAMRERVRARLSMAPATVLDLARVLCPSLEDRAALNATLWRMLARRELSMDWYKPLSMKSLVWL